MHHLRIERWFALGDEQRVMDLSLRQFNPLGVKISKLKFLKVVKELKLKLKCIVHITKTIGRRFSTQL